MVRILKICNLEADFFIGILFPAAAALRGVAIQTNRARTAFPTRTFARLPTPMSNASAANTLHGYAP